MANCKSCGSQIPNRIKIGNQIKYINRRKYCLTCSPFGEIHKRRSARDAIVSDFCRLCKRPRGSSTDICRSCQIKVRRYRIKIAAIQYKGGSCQECNWVGGISAFHFHHTDPDEKEFNISQASQCKWEVIKKELDKCILLCSICHNLEHSSELDEEFMNEVWGYRGIPIDLDMLNPTLYRLPIPDKDCQSCGIKYKPNNIDQKYCSKKCSTYSQRKILWPSKEELKPLINVMSWTSLGKKYGVSDNAVRNWARKYELI